MASEPDPKIPPGSTTVSVSLIDVGSFGPPKFEGLMGPPISGLEQFPHLSSYAFLIEHPSGRRVVFDLGVRKDTANLSRFSCNFYISRGYQIRAPKTVNEILEDNKILDESIEAIIWRVRNTVRRIPSTLETMLNESSHCHWDHLGDPSLFPMSTSLVVGPGFKNAYCPGAPANPDSWFLESDYAGRPFVEIEFPPSSPQISSLPAHDYFSDGSFYLISAPGHMTGHLIALARTSSSSFVLLAADAAHHGAELRPSANQPLPQPLPTTLPETVHAELSACVTPETFSRLQVSRGMPACGPCFYPTIGEDKALARETLEKLEVLDADERVLTVMAHDRFVVKALTGKEQYEGGKMWRLDTWREDGVGERVKWLFLEDLKDGFERVVREADGT